MTRPTIAPPPGAILAQRLPQNIAETRENPVNQFAQSRSISLEVRSKAQ
jgi:hypothetical protein